MMIGQKIKELRKKCDMTQEKLADCLGVSYQAVSKWECGISCPDLSLIVPLTKLLGVSADELLGCNRSNEHEIEERLKKEFDDTYRTGDISERMRISGLAAKEFPTDMKWKANYGWAIWCYALDCIHDDTAFEAEREKAIKLFGTVIENSDDTETRCYAITGMVQCLCGKGEKKEALRYAELYPDIKISPQAKEELIANCLEGEEKSRQKQKIPDDKLGDLVTYLLFQNVGHDNIVLDAAEQLITTMLPDRNYLHYHYYFYIIYFRKARAALPDKISVEYLKKALYHAKEYTKLESFPTEYTFTSPLFDRLTYNSCEWYKTGSNTLTDDLLDTISKAPFNVLHKYPEYRSIHTRIK